jgi:signal transduction histidine kinase
VKRLHSGSKRLAIRLSSGEGTAEKLSHKIHGPGTTPAAAVLLAAATTVAEEWQRWTSADPDAAELAGLGRRMVDAVRDCEQDGAITVDPRLRSPTGRRLLQMIRGAVMRIWAERAATANTREVLASFDALLRLDEALDPASVLQSLAPLTGPEGPELVVDVAHDLRSPVTSILFLAETLQSERSGQVNELQRRQLGLIYSAALGLSTVVSDLIELAHGGDRLTDQKPSSFSLTETLEAVRDITRPIAEEKGLTVNLKSVTPDYRLGYPMAVSRVLLNLTTNALKFTEEGTVDIQAVSTNWTTIEFSVRDTGPGMKPAALGNLYRPFRRTPGDRHFHFSGTGLGLTICRRLVKAMGSELLVDTGPEKGTRFSFEIEVPPVGTV